MYTRCVYAVEQCDKYPKQLVPMLLMHFHDIAVTCPTTSLKTTLHNFFIDKAAAELCMCYSNPDGIY